MLKTASTKEEQVRTESNGIVGRANESTLHWSFQVSDLRGEGGRKDEEMVIDGFL